MDGNKLSNQIFPLTISWQNKEPLQQLMSKEITDINHKQKRNW